MDKMNLFLSSKSTIISEDKNYLELLNRVCYYAAPNGNGTRLPYDDTTIEKAQTLVGMPVVAKYTVDALGKPTFKGHEVSIDTNGEITFGTTPIGVHTEVYIQDDTVELPDKSIATLPCLFSKQKIWKRNRNAVAAINRLFAENNLHNSWEISVSEYKFADGIKDLINYVFDGNCFLGLAKPAYGSSAEVLTVATDEMLVAEALSQDLIEASENPQGNEVQTMNENEIEIENEEETPAVPPVAEEAEELQPTEEPQITEPPEEKPAVAELTIRDLRFKIEEALYKFTDKYLDVVFIFPESHTGWAHDWNESETDMYEFTYSVENNEVTIASNVAVQLLVSPRQINATLEAKNSALIEANNQIEMLKAENATLTPFKEAYEKAEQEKAEAIRLAQIAELRQFAEDSNVFSKEEIESEEISSLISSLKTVEVKSLIADRVVAKMGKSKKPETAQKNAPKEKIDIDFSEEAPDPYSLLKKFIHK